MSEEELNRLKIRLQLAEDNNKILNQRMKEKNKDLDILNKLYQKEKNKTSKIINTLARTNIDEIDLKKCIEWIISVIKEDSK